MRQLGIAVLLVACLALAGCAMLPVALTSSARLAQYGNDAAVKVVADARTEVVKVKVEAAKEVAAAKTEVVKLKAAKPTSLWPIYLVGAICLAGGAALGYWLGRIALGVMLAIGGAGCIAWAQFLERFPWAMWIPFGLIIAGAAYMVWDYWQTDKAAKAAKAVNNVLIPAIEKIEPKVYGDAPSGPVKAAVKATASRAVGAEIAAIKAKLGI
ncbi:MAG: hypothetical protein V1929_06560 [bacterium]